MVCVSRDAKCRLIEEARFEFLFANHEYLLMAETRQAVGAVDGTESDTG